MNPKLRHALAAIPACVLVLASWAGAQASPGFRLIVPLGETDTYLLDRDGIIVHIWPSSHLPGVSAYVLEDGSLLRSIKTPDAVLPGDGGGVQRIGLDGTVLWDFRHDGPDHLSHHDMEPLPNGNVLMIAYDTKTFAEAVAAGRDPALISGSVMRPDSVIEVQPTGPTTGTIVWEWHMWDHLIQDFDPTKANYGVVGDHPELLDINFPPDASLASDFNHMNSVKYDAVHDRIILSAFGQGEIYVIDHSTTTAEAAGHTGGNSGRGGDILYRFGNPEVYDHGTSSNREFYNQHSARVIPPGHPGAGHFTVFNNDPPAGTSVVWEFAPPLNDGGNFVLNPYGTYGPADPLWTYTNPAFYSPFVSSAERLPNGHMLICSGVQGWVFEIDPAGAVVASYIHAGILFHAHYVERTLWPEKSVIRAGIGEASRFDVIVGSEYSDLAYVLLASASGTTPGIPLGGGRFFPLNPDDIMLFSYTNANSTLLQDSFGVLNVLGHATATVDLPAFMLASPVSIDLAAAVLDLGTAAIVTATNPVPLTIVP